MPYSVQAKNAMLDALGGVAVYMSVHKAAPGATGANELTGSTRQAVTWNAAATGSKTQSNNPAFTGLSTGEPVAYVGLWSAASGGTWYGYQQVTVTSGSGGGTWTYTTAAGTIDLNATASA
jgi:hypothetical protein